MSGACLIIALIVSSGFRRSFHFFFFFNDTATTEIYTSVNTLSLHDALPIWRWSASRRGSSRNCWPMPRPRSEEHTSELQSLTDISYAVFCLKKKKIKKIDKIQNLHDNNEKHEIVYDNK